MLQCMLLSVLQPVCWQQPHDFPARTIRAPPAFWTVLPVSLRVEGLVDLVLVCVLWIECAMIHLQLQSVGAVHFTMHCMLPDSIWQANASGVVLELMT